MKLNFKVNRTLDLLFRSLSSFELSDLNVSWKPNQNHELLDGSMELELQTNQKQGFLTR